MSNIEIPRKMAKKITCSINNSGSAPDQYRDRGLFDGLIINGLVIRGATPDPYRYYAKRLIHGPNAFVEVAENFDDYPRAIKRKLLRELTPAGLAMAPRGTEEPGGEPHRKGAYGTEPHSGDRLRTEPR